LVADSAYRHTYEIFKRVDGRVLILQFGRFGGSLHGENGGSYAALTATSHSISTLRRDTKGSEVG